MEQVGYDMAYMFKYSERPKTLAERKYEDDVPEEVKGRRLTEIIDLQMKSAAKRTKQHVGKVQRVLIEGTSKKSAEHYQGRNSQNVVVVFPKTDRYQLGQYVQVRMLDCTSVTLIGEVVE
jgi:tRNA-2-methylthio-N6-dimethylallyladenosine synthase